MEQELLSQFLEEAVELFESLNEHLVDLESDVTNKETLNEIFRAFHTIKGGAGFLELKPMVELCHLSEDIFDKIRSGKRSFSSADMDVFSKVLDELGVMFDKIGNGNFSLAKPVELIEELDSMLEAIPGSQVVECPKAIDLTLVSDERVESEKLDELDAFFDTIKQAPEINAIEQEPVAFDENSEIVDTPHSSDRTKTKKTDSTVVRVDTSKIDDIVNLVGELVLNRNRLKQVAQSLESQELLRGISALDFITSELQSSVMKTRMQPVKRVFQRFPRMVRDLARSLGKDIEMVMIGEETELDKNLVDALADPMIHMIRNSVDHGVEEPLQRAEKGKPRTGTITVKAEQVGDHIEITISDDGKGIDAAVMKQKAFEKGIISEQESDGISETEALQLIFAPGFSTAEKVTDLSGRGVGMDVVKTTVERLNGYVSINSKMGFGTTFTLKIPLTMAIMQTLMVGIGGHNYAIPLPGISEIFIYDRMKINVVDGQSLSRLREGSVPVFYLEELLPPQLDIEHNGVSRKVVVVNIADKLAGVVVDDVIGLEEVVIKPLGAFLHNMNEYAGATITGNGKVALILDVNKLLTLT